MPSRASGHELDFDDRSSNQGGLAGRDRAGGTRRLLGDGRHLDRGEEAPGGSTRYTVDVEGSSATSTRRSSPRSTVTHEVVGDDLDAGAIRQCVELSAMKYCPVSAMLSAGPTAIHHRYRMRRHAHRRRPTVERGRSSSPGPSPAAATSSSGQRRRLTRRAELHCYAGACIVMRPWRIHPGSGERLEATDGDRSQVRP